MKTFKYINILLLLVFTAFACTDDFSKTEYDPANAKAGELLPLPQSEYVLLVENAEQAVATFQWGAMEFGFPAAVKYTLEVDLQGNNFANAEEITSVNATKAEVLTNALNRAMIALQKVHKFVHETPQDVEFRVKGSISNAAEPVYSSVIKANITPYFEYNKVWIIGDYCGWGHGASQFLYEYDEARPNIHEAWIDFDGKALNGFKVTGAANWDNGNWGLKDGETPDAEAESMTLWNDGGSKDIKVYSKRFYKFAFNNKTLELKKVASMNSFGITGSAITSASDFAMSFDPKNQVFTALVTLTDGEIKFRADNQDGDLSFGKGAADGSLAKGGAGIAVKAGTYKVTVNLNNSLDMRYAIEVGEALDPSRIKAPVLNEIGNISMHVESTKEFTWSAVDFDGQEATKVSYALQIDLTGANFANAITLATIQETKFAANGQQLFDALKKLDPALELGNTKSAEFRVVANVASLEEPFTSNISKSDVTIVPVPAMPEEMYMIGNDFGGWAWENEGVVKMIPVNGAAGKFWTIKYFKTSTEFKWNSKLAWGGEFAGKDNNIGFEHKEGGNAIVKTAGLYMVFIDLNTNTIKMETPQVFGMGDAFGSWDMGAHLMTIEGDKINITTSGIGELRLYANSSISGIGGDWWKMEFIIIDGKIEYRGNGGDQARVSVATGQKVTLDFANDTGTIE